jgi:hypothetical protein
MPDLVIQNRLQAHIPELFEWAYSGDSESSVSKGGFMPWSCIGRSPAEEQSGTSTWNSFESRIGGAGNDRSFSGIRFGDLIVKT